jgi:nitrate reductase alpha subunit
MSHLLDRLSFFNKEKAEEFSNGHGKLVYENRDWERAYRGRWGHDKVVRSTHGVNCTGSCSWKIYVKNGLVTWETQQTNYPRTRPDLPDHEPRGCPRGASYSWYLYSSTRLKYPLIRSKLLRIWRESKRQNADPVDAWKAIVNDKEKSREYKEVRGLGGMVRADWEEVNEIIAASNIYTAKTYGPDRVVGFSPIPAMSMVSYAAGSRYLSLIGGTCLSFYDWYCDLPPSSPQVWGEQTDVPESADWYNSSYIMAWGSNVPQTRTPDAHFFTETRYSGTKTIAVTPDFSEVAKLSDEWMAPTQGTDAALAMTMGHIILKEYHLDNKSEYFTSYIKQYTDMPFLVILEEKNDILSPTRTLRASDMENTLGEKDNTEWKPLLIDENTNEIVIPTGTIGSRWDGSGKWNIESKNVKNGEDISPKTTLKNDNHEVVSVGFPNIFTS